MEIGPASITSGHPSVLIPSFSTWLIALYAELNARFTCRQTLFFQHNHQQSIPVTHHTPGENICAQIPILSYVKTFNEFFWKLFHIFQLNGHQISNWLKQHHFTHLGQVLELSEQPLKWNTNSQPSNTIEQLIAFYWNAGGEWRYCRGYSTEPNIMVVWDFEWVFKSWKQQAGFSKSDREAGSLMFIWEGKLPC